MKEMLKKVFVGLVILPLLGVLVMNTATSRTRAAGDDFDAAGTFKAKCLMCHGADASKKFDPALADDVLIEVVLKGKDAAPIKMPAYEAKGLTADQAKALVTYMKSLRQK